MSVRTLARFVEMVSWFFVVLGISLPFAFHTLPFSMYRKALAAWAYGGAAIPSADEKLLGLMLGITGGSIAGKWLVHALIARGPLAEGKAWARDLTLAGLALWFLADSAASLMLGASFNVWMINLAPLLLVGLPLLRGRARFADAPGGNASEAPAPRTTTRSQLCFWTSVVGVGTGIGIAFGGTTALFSLWFHGLESAHYAGLPVTDSARSLALFFFGPIGGCTIAQFAMLAAWVGREGSRARVAFAGTISLATWFGVDSIYGIAHDGLFNIAMVNLPAIVMTLPGWLLLGSEARRSPH